MDFDPYCLSSFLTFRYVTRKDAQWIGGVRPRLAGPQKDGRISVRTPTQILEALRLMIPTDGKTAILLSGGIDSAILARLLPQGARAYTIRFLAESSVDETDAAAYYAREASLRHSVVEVGWKDYLDSCSMLMERKASPLHAIEVPLYVAARRAREDGVARLVVGNGADSTFGGLDRLLSRDWSYREFIERYTFVDPKLALVTPVSTEEVWSEYRQGHMFDTQRFLKEVHGLGVVQSFQNAIQAAGLDVVEPYEQLLLDGELDMVRIRSGDSKYLLRQVFQELYPSVVPPVKVPFARPMGEWFRNATMPSRKEFRADMPWKGFTGDQRWLVWCLDEFLSLLQDKRQNGAIALGLDNPRGSTT